jgi:methylglutamate dehydrogenase subunit D
LRARIGTAGAVTDQSDARVVLQVGGSLAADALAKGVGIDLHPRSFAPGDVAVTLVGHVSALLWREESGFGCAVASGYAASVAAFLIDAALEFGLEVS